MLLLLTKILLLVLQTLLSEFNKEQEAFIKAKGGKGGEALPPWVGYPDEESLKEEILALSTVSTISSREGTFSLFLSLVSDDKNFHHAS